MQNLIKVVLGIFISLQINAQSITFDLGGSISCEDNRPLQGALINVTRDGKPFTSFLTSFEGTYYLYLPLGSDYIVNVSKKGYVHKMFTVNTTGIPAERALKKFPVIIADLELIDFYEGVDYSLFEQPINKYYYNPKKENFEYDKVYLKNMLALIEEVKNANKQAIQLAKEKAEKDKRDSELALEKAFMEERMAAEALLLKKLDEELAEAKKLRLEKDVAKAAGQVQIAVIQPSVVDALTIGTSKTERIISLLIKYKPGVTEELIEGQNVIIIQRVLVKDEMAWVYQKKIFNWGGTACFRDGEPITESIFELETKKHS